MGELRSGPLDRELIRPRALALTPARTLTAMRAARMCSRGELQQRLGHDDFVVQSKQRSGATEPTIGLSERKVDASGHAFVNRALYGELRFDTFQCDGTWSLTGSIMGVVSGQSTCSIQIKDARIPAARSPWSTSECTRTMCDPATHGQDSCLLLSFCETTERLVRLRCTRPSPRASSINNHS